MNREYIRPQDWGDNYDPPHTEPHQRAAWGVIFLTLLFALFCWLIAPSARAQSVVAPTRITTFDFQCQDKDRNKLSDHTRVDIAIITCINDPKGAYVQGGTYRINRPAATATAALSWKAPTTNTDGTPLTDLAGYRIHYGKSESALVETLEVGPSVTAYTIANLDAGTWYFAVTAFTSGGAESALSNIASKTI